MPKRILLGLSALLFCTLPTSAQDRDAALRGKKALETRAFTPAPWSFAAYENAWKLWQPKLDKAPDNYDQAFREHYGLHPTPFENGRHPMGLRQGEFLFVKGLATDCLLCHGGSI